MTDEEQTVVDAVTAKLIGFKAGDRVRGKGQFKNWRGVIVKCTLYVYWRVQTPNGEQGLFYDYELEHDHS